MGDYRYLNRGNRWQDFTWDGLELTAGGSLQLSTLPIAAPAVTIPADTPAPDAPAGVVVVPGGDVYISDPAGHRVLLVSGCDATLHEVCGPGDVHAPRGLAYHRGRQALLVADGGSGRVLLVDLGTHQLTETWAGFTDPWSLAVDAAGDVYVADHGAHQVRKLNRSGRPRPWSWAPGDVAPAEVTVRAGGTVVILDATSGRVYETSTDGHPVASWDSGLHRPMGLGTHGTTTYIGDNELRQLLVFGAGGRLAGPAYGWQGPVTAVGIGPAGELYIHTGAPVAPSVLAGTGAYRTHGVAWGGPFANPSIERQPWHLLRAALTPSGPGAHFQLYLSTRQTQPPVDLAADDPFSDPGWQSPQVAPDAAETLFAGESLDTVWVGVQMRGEGLATPVLSQIRIDFAHPTPLRYLPAIYRDDDASRQFLARWLTLFESGFDSEHELVEGLAALFDPAAADPRFLPWLAGWLALELPGTWPTGRQRQAIADAFSSYASRGTAADLIQALHSELGLTALVEEPIVQSGWWALPDDDPSPAQAELSVLGVSTVAAVAEPQGAVLGTTAVLDGSTLSPQEEYARALFADVAHQFTVRLYRGAAFSDQALSDASAVVAGHAPAHAAYHVCVVDPCLRVGVQARVGIDAIVGDLAAADIALDAAASGGLVLGGEVPSHLGRDSELGHIYLTDGRPVGELAEGGNNVRALPDKWPAPRPADA
jgi:phage tail-like protein